MKAYIQLGRIGDVISILPILQHESEKSQSQPVGFTAKIPLVIAKEYASLLEGVSYVEPIIWKGDANDLAGAVLFAKKRFSQVVVLQCHGNMPVQHHTPSFQFDQWQRAGALAHFEDWPLTFDCRNKLREASVIALSLGNAGTGLYPYILFADHSKSSPFIHKQELHGMLVNAFPDHRIIRLSEIRCERIYDVLALMDHASCLVTVETAHLHLSRASKVPTVALAASGWRGSAFSKRFKFFMRYPEWESRKHDLIEAVKRVIGHEGADIAPYPPIRMIATGRNGYNPSLIKFGETLFCFFRYHPHGSWKTKLRCATIEAVSSSWDINPPARFKDYSVEDLRAFEFNGKLHGCYVMSTAIDGHFRCYIAYGEIKGNEIDHIQIQHPENNLMGMTKNYVPFVHEGKLHFLHGIKGDKQHVLQVDGSVVSSDYSSPAPTWARGEIRGGCIVAHNGAYLRFFHSRVQYSDKTQRYFIGASIMEAKPAFKTLAVSKRPILQGDERYTPGCHHWKANCCLPYGVIKQDGKFLLSYGANDCECCIAELTIDSLNL